MTPATRWPPPSPPAPCRRASRWSQEARGRGFRIGRIGRIGRTGSASMVSLAHGANDAQKTMGVITLALIANGSLPAHARAQAWVIISCALAISLGTCIGGWRVIRALGRGLTEIEAPQGLAAESASAATILLSSSFGYSLPRRDRLGHPQRRRAEPSPCQTTLIPCPGD